MKSRTGYIKKLIYFIDYLKANPYVSGKQLEEYMQSRGFPFSEDTRRRFFEDVDNDYGLVIQRDAKKGGFYIAEEDEDFDSEWTNRLYRFLEFADRATFVIDSLTEAKEALRLVDFGSSRLKLSPELIREALKSVMEKRQVHFVYKAFYSDKGNTHDMQPYLLKEYQGRWYIIGYELELKAIRTYALDRIQDFEITDKVFKNRDLDQVLSRLESIVGVNYSAAEPQELVIKYFGYQVNYQESLPLHHSATLVERNPEEDSATYRYHLAPNFELEQRILMLGEQVEVLKPLAFRKKVIQHLENARSRYRD